MGRGNFALYDAKNTQELQQIAEDAAATLASVVSEMGQESCNLDIFGLRIDGKDIGNWSVTVERQESGVFH